MQISDNAQVSFYEHDYGLRAIPTWVTESSGILWHLSCALPAKDFPDEHSTGMYRFLLYLLYMFNYAN